MRENTLERPAEPQVRYSDLFWLFLAGSVLGVIIEGVFCVVTKGRWESHVVSVWGWFNVLYGLGAAGLYAGAVKLRHRPLLARAAILMGVATALELACGMLLKWGLGMRAWDYSHNFLNFSGIICLRFSLYWGAGGPGGLPDRVPDHRGPGAAPHPDPPGGLPGDERDFSGELFPHRRGHHPVERPALRLRPGQPLHPDGGPGGRRPVDGEPLCGMAVFE